VLGARFGGEAIELLAGGQRNRLVVMRVKESLGSDRAPARCSSGAILRRQGGKAN
jgi:hypothetical protein